MTQKLSIYMAQINPTVGDIAGNRALIDAAYGRGAAAGADLVITPELSVIGYPPEDLVLKPAFQKQAMAVVEAIKALTAPDGAPGLMVGTCWLEQDALYNAVLLLEGGAIAGITRKLQLPNYGVFDELRLFTAPAGVDAPIRFRGVSLGVLICEDMWFDIVAARHKQAGAEILLVPTASPYETDKADDRAEVAAARVKETGLPLLFTNQVGGQDELVFDGRSFVMDATGKEICQMPAWGVGEMMTHWHQTSAGWVCAPSFSEPLARPAPLSLEEDIYQAMVTGLRDYVEKNRFPGVLLGLSGGVDSALSAAVAVDALGPERVDCVMMPSRYTSQASLDDAKACAAKLGVRYRSIAVEPAIEAFGDLLAEDFADHPSDATEENIQSRVRGLLLMALSNKFGRMVLTTGNKSEMSVGYATLYGDMCGGFSVLKDVYKTMVFKLCDWRNAHLPSGVLGKAGEAIPPAIITKPPSAELRDDQKDQDSLPPYDALDDMLVALVDEELSVDEVVARGHSREEVARVERLLYIAEYKRRQSPPGVKITRKNFGRDRRYPLTNGFRSARETKI